VSKPDFSLWTLRELLAAPWIDSKTIEGMDFWLAVFGKTGSILYMADDPGERVWPEAMTERVKQWKAEGRP
jgi:hypothetical protein